MKFNYIFVNQNNGHGDTYHPFSSNSVLTQEKVTEWLMQIPGATYFGTGITKLFDKLDEHKIDFEEFQCPCCEKPVPYLKDVYSEKWKIYGIEWIFLEGVLGSY